MIELTHITQLASHCSSLFSVPATKYTHTLQRGYLACFDSERPRLGDPRGLTSSEGLMADGTAIGRSHAEEITYQDRKPDYEAMVAPL